MAQATPLRSAAPARSREAVITCLQKHEAEIRSLGATGLFLFGSGARDTLRPGSDIDLFVDYNRDGTFDFVRLCRLEEFLAACIGMPVDLGTRHGLHPALRLEIERTSVRVF
jgi:uncharacterized protein